MKWYLARKQVCSTTAALLALVAVDAAEPGPSFTEVRDLLKTNLVEADEAALDRAGAEGMLRAFAPWVSIVTNGQPAEAADGMVLPKATVYDGVVGYLRVTSMEDRLVKDLSDAMDGLTSSNKLKGWVLDLRYADGPDYRAAARVADRFANKEQVLIDFGQGPIRSTAKPSSTTLPVMVLINGQTSRAAEALAAMLRLAGPAMLLGTNTAGRAFLTKDFPLRSGQFLRIATALVKAGGAEPLSRQGVRPDILVTVNPAQERASYEDPYRPLLKPSLGEVTSGSDSPLAATLTNRAGRPRLNEAELVRMLREGMDPDTEGPMARSTGPTRPVLRDPALVRALDLLKGLAMIRGTTPQ
jgi:hypothetical protein